MGWRTGMVAPPVSLVLVGLFEAFLLLAFLTGHDLVFTGDAI